MKSWIRAMEKIMKIILMSHKRKVKKKRGARAEASYEVLKAEAV